MRFVDDRIIVDDRVRANASRRRDGSHLRRDGAINRQPNGVIRQDAWRHDQTGADLTGGIFPASDGSR